MRNHWIVMTTETHIPVMLAEVIQAADCSPDSLVIDCTFGRGGHTRSFLDTGAIVIALDVDHEAEDFAHHHFQAELKSKQLFFFRKNFTELESTVHQLGQQHPLAQISTIFYDFGTSSNQLLSAERGFSFQDDGPLDMRMDTRLSVTATDLLAVVPENQLADLFFYEGGEPYAKKIARTIKKKLPITQTSQLVSIISSIKGRKGKLHPATQVFQALRIAVNTELSNITTSLPQALSLLKPGGKLITIAFHEGEDALVKHFFVDAAQQNHGIRITKKPLTPSEKEKKENPRSRSAKLRIFEKQQ